MEDKEYRKFIEELGVCRYSSDKIAFIKEKVRSIDDMEDLLLDVKFSFEEACQILNLLGDVEFAALLQRHLSRPDIQAVDLSSEEQTLRLYLVNYINRLPEDRYKGILEIKDRLV